MNRKPWLAGLLSLIAPGLGQLYNSQLRKALALFFGVPLLAIVNILILLHFPMWPVNLVVPLAVQIGVVVLMVRDAVRTARGLGPQFRPAAYSRWYVYVAAVALYAFVFSPAWRALARSTGVRSFVAQSANMEPNVLPGDYLLADAWRGGVRRGDVIVFSWPGEGDNTFMFRLIGLPGDTIQMRNRVLSVQGQQIAEPRVRHSPEDFEHAAMLWQLAHLKSAADSLASRPTLNNWGPLVVPAGMYFVLGDNRAASLDSRLRGFVPADRVIGRLHRAYFSRDPETGRIRWGRLGKAVG